MKRVLYFLEDFSAGLLVSSIKVIIVISFAVAITGGSLGLSELYLLRIFTLIFALADTFIGYVVAPLIKYASDKWESSHAG